MQEIRSHTALRGVAALFVVIYHFVPQLRPTLDVDSYTHALSRGPLWVDFFFILSGYILCYVYAVRPGTGRRAATEFLWARIARIYPLHLATLLFLAIFQFVLVKILHKEGQIGEWYTFWLNLI